MTVEHDVSVKDTLSLVTEGSADQGELSEGVNVTVGAHRSDQLGWQRSSSSLDGHRVRGEGMKFWEKRGVGAEGRL